MTRAHVKRLRDAQAQAAKIHALTLASDLARVLDEHDAMRKDNEHLRAANRVLKAALKKALAPRRRKS